MTDNPQLDGLAQMAYHQYGATTGGKNYQGLPMPDYADLGEAIQAAWRAAAGAVARAVTVPDGRQRFHRIADAHSKHVTGGGMTSGDCHECGHRWPCPTYVWATTERASTATWDPADDDLSDAGADAMMADPDAT